MKEKFLKKQLLASTVVAGFASALFAAPVVAQDQDADAEARQDLIVVTGTRIAQPNLESPTAVNTFNSAQIELSGAVNVSELIRTVPATGVSSLTSTNSNFTVQSSGLNTVELRNLGEDRTLVLVNGRRFVPGVPGSQVVDLNSIPTDFIERIDVVTGGASAVYGSDALAGVVNIILKDSFEGVQLSAQTGITEEGDDESFKVSLTAGTSLADGKGSIMTSLTWDKDNGVYARDRENSVDGANLAFFTGNPDDYRQELVPFFSSFSEKGRVIVPNNGNHVLDDDGVVKPFVTARDGFNRQAFRALAVPTERVMISTVFNYEFREGLEYFLEGTYATTGTKSSLEPFPLSSEDIFGDQLPFYTDTDMDGRFDTTNRAGYNILNPFVPADIANLARAGADLDNDGVQDLPDSDIYVGFARRTTELDQRGSDNERDTFRIATGLKGEIGDVYDWEVSATWGRTQQSQNSTGQINVVNFRNAMDAVVDINGNIVCADPIAVLEGCIPVNIFGRGSITAGLTDTQAQALLTYLKAPSSRQAEIEEIVLNGYITGSPVELPAGPLNIAIGAEYRYDESTSIPDALSQAGLNAGNISPAVLGDFDVVEAFAEVEIPLLADMAFAKSLTTNLAIRASDYSTIGSTIAYAASAEWVPHDDVRVRGQYSHAVRAPNISELFQPLSQTFPTVTDPCEGLTLDGGVPSFLVNITNGASGPDATRTGSQQAVNCFADPALAARVNGAGFFVLTQPERQGVSGFNGGAAAGGATLKEEEADTFTFGVVYNPTFNEWLEPLVVSVDYFNIEITDGIAGLGRNTSLNNCYTTAAAFNPGSPFCQNIIRFQGGPQVGALRFVNSFQQNLAEITTSGIDFQASYDMDLNDLPFLSNVNWNLGNLATSVVYALTLEDENIAFQGAPLTDDLGEIGAQEHEALLTFVWERENLTVAIDNQIIGNVELDRDSGTFAGAEIGPRIFTDLQARYDVNDTVQLLFGVDNVFNEYVRIGAFGPGTSTGWNTAPDVYDGLGRRFYLGTKFKF